MASFTKNKSGSWKAEIRRKGWPKVYKTFRIKRDAEDWARVTEDEIIRGIYVPRNNSEKVTVGSALNRYVAEITPTKKAGTVKPETFRATVIKDRLGQYSLAAINSEVVAKFRDGRLNEGMANNTVRLELALLSHLYTIAIKEWGLGLTVNPVLNIRKPSPGQGRNRRLIGDEEERLMEACEQHPNPFLSWIVRIALATAMRVSEITSLTRDQVNLKNRTILLPDTKNNTVRTVPLSSSGFAAISEAIESTFQPPDTNLIFFGEPGKDGLRRSYTINKVWGNALNRAGIEDLKFHDLRHEATSRFVEAGLSDQEVSSITGHKSMQMLKRYTHLRNEDLVGKLSSL